MSGAEPEYRDVHVVHEELIAPPQPAPEPVPVEPVEESEDEEMEVASLDAEPIEEEEQEDSEEDPSEHEEMEGTASEAVSSDQEEEAIEDSTDMRELFIAVIDRNVELRNRNSALEAQLEDLRTEYQAVQSYWEAEIDDRILAEGRVQELKVELRAKKAKIGRMTQVYRSSHQEYQREIAYHPIETGQTRHTISRDIVIDIADEMYADAIRRGLV